MIKYIIFISLILLSSIVYDMHRKIIKTNKIKNQMFGRCETAKELAPEVYNDRFKEICERER